MHISTLSLTLFLFKNRLCPFSGLFLISKVRLGTPRKLSAASGRINTHKTFEYFGLSLEEMMRPQNILTYTRITSTGFVNNFKYITHIFDPSLKVKLRPEAGSVAYRTGYCNIKTCTHLTWQIYTQIRYVHTRCTHKNMVISYQNEFYKVTVCLKAWYSWSLDLEHF